MVRRWRARCWLLGQRIGICLPEELAVWICRASSVGAPHMTAIDLWMGGRHHDTVG